MPGDKDSNLKKLTQVKEFALLHEQYANAAYAWDLECANLISLLPAGARVLHSQEHWRNILAGIARGQDFAQEYLADDDQGIEKLQELFQQAGKAWEGRVEVACKRTRFRIVTVTFSLPELDE